MANLKIPMDGKIEIELSEEIFFCALFLLLNVWKIVTQAKTLKSKSTKQLFGKRVKKLSSHCLTQSMTYDKRP